MERPARLALSIGPDCHALTESKRNADELTARAIPTQTGKSERWTHQAVANPRRHGSRSPL
jgi:hypothetical protein